MLYNIWSYQTDKYSFIHSILHMFMNCAYEYDGDCGDRSDGDWVREFLFAKYSFLIAASRRDDVFPSKSYDDDVHDDARMSERNINYYFFRCHSIRVL